MYNRLLTNQVPIWLYAVLALGLLAMPGQVKLYSKCAHTHIRTYAAVTKAYSGLNSDASLENKEYA